jgi:hypothetical protein
MRQKNIFCGIFGQSAKILSAEPQIKFQNLRKFWVKIQKMGIGFNQMWLKGSHHD